MKSPRIRVGGRVRVRLTGEQRAMTGRVVGIDAGIADRERLAAPTLLSNVSSSFRRVRSGGVGQAAQA